MKTLVLLLGVVVLTSAIDFSNLRRPEDLDSFWDRLDPSLQKFRNTKAIPDRRILGGDLAELGQFPYQAVVTAFWPNGNNIFCGGILVSTNFVLTAAHCVISDSPASFGTIMVGAQNRQQQEPSQQNSEFGTITPHPNYVASLLRNDIAIISLASPVVFTEFVQPAVLPALSDTRTFAGLTGTVSGFGRTSNTAGSPVSNQLWFTSNPIMSNADCQAIWGTTWVTEQNICMSQEGGRTICHGDSGGPLTVAEDGGSLVVGMVSFLHVSGCISDFPPGFVRMSHYLEWIAEETDADIRD
ncbi:brachyurin-like [Malaya genurostris]|uniref:brachyurin-like n=1 Tax=Malaya genurostris TaxID=325434 RepID=UPI0026F38363|nr:brachyurin-like [Malaya genurostris]